MSKKVVLSAGHSLNDSGAVNRDADLKENFLTIRIVNLAIPLLKAHGVKVDTIPDELSLIETINLINSKFGGHDLAIEIHINAGGGTGVEGWHYHNSEVSKQLTNDILNSLVSETGMRNRGAKDEFNNRWGRLGFVHDTKPLATLIECGFIDHPDDAKFLATEEGRYKMARGLARGICANLGISWNPDKLPEDGDEACQERIKDLETKLKKSDDRGDEWKKKTRAVRDDFDKFKKNEYSKAIELANELEQLHNDAKEKHNDTKKELTNVEREFKHLRDVEYPKQIKLAQNATEALGIANAKIDRYMEQNYTFGEALHFLMKAFHRNKGGDE